MGSNASKRQAARGESNLEAVCASEENPFTARYGTSSFDIQPEELALLIIMRQAGCGGFSGLDFKGGKPYMATSGLQRFDFTDQEFIEKVVSRGESVVMFRLDQ